MSKKNKYPRVNCETFADNYLGKHDMWQHDAIVEFKINRLFESKNLKTAYEGTLQCFCQFENQKLGIPKSQIYDGWDKNRKLIFQEPICSYYAKDLLISKILGTSIAFIIVTVNVILRTIIVTLCLWIGEDTQSQQKSIIKDGVFYAQFFNTAIIILLVNANLGEAEFIPKQIKSVFDGPFYDYYPEWYNDVGLKIIQTMCIGMVLPTLNILRPMLILYLKQKYDTKGTFCKYNTRSSSLAKYKLNYGGEEYFVHYRYSELLKIVYITMMYGIGIPLLFPIAALSIILAWLIERYSCAYIVKLPPAMGDTMTQTSISALRFAPIIMLINGYWMVSNRQIFENKWAYIHDSMDPMKSLHKIHLEINWAVP